MATFAAIIETAIGGLRLCEKCYNCCEKINKDKEDENKENEDKEDKDKKDDDKSGSEKESDSEEKPKAKKAKSKKAAPKTGNNSNVKYSAVNQKEKEPITAQPQPGSVLNQFNPVIDIENTPYGSAPTPANQPSAPAEQSGQANPGAPTAEQSQKQPAPVTTQPMPAVQNYFNPVVKIVNSPYLSHHAHMNGQLVASAVSTEQSVVEWAPSNMETASQLLDRAVVGGYDIDESDLWVIRSRFKGEIVPGKLNYQYGLAFAAHKKDNNYAEKNVSVFEVCCIDPEFSHKIKWIPSSDGNVPENAVVGGKRIDGEKLYIGRQTHYDEKHKDRKSLCPGLIQPSLKALLITYDFKVYAHAEYEVLCFE